MTRYVWDYELDKWVEPRSRTRGDAGPFIVSDLTAFKSPLGHGVIDGRRDLREHLARNECRIVETGEYKPTYVNERHAK